MRREFETSDTFDLDDVVHTVEPSRRLALFWSFHALIGQAFFASRCVSLQRRYILRFGEGDGYQAG